MSFLINEFVHTLPVEYLFHKTCLSQKTDSLSILTKAFIASLFRKTDFKRDAHICNNMFNAINMCK